MQDEELDKLINDAASQHHPPYNDTSWGKMELLLDKHLPVKKDRRKLIFWLFLFLLAGGGVTLGILQPWKKTVTNTAITKNADKKQPVNTTAKIITTPADNIAAVPDNNANDILVKQNTETFTATTPDKNSISVLKNNTLTAPLTTQSKNTVDKTVAENGGKKIISFAKTVTGKKEVLQTADNKKTSYKRKSRSSIKVKNPVTDSNNDVIIQKADAIKDEGNDNIAALSGKEKQNDVAAAKITEEKKEVIAVTPDSVNKTTGKKDELAKKAPAHEKKKADKSFAGNFAFTLSAGADVSYISINNTGKLKSFYGAGARYNLSKRFTVSTGFYVSRKIYTAAPNQYKFPSGGPRPNLININANCKIYEIPFSIQYNFKPVKKHNWFGGVGISSFIMKKESYDYQYKTPTGQTWNYLKEVSNENKHYFSALTLSGGYQYTISNKFSFIAEPYIKLPLKGIGYGKIKLNSAGLLFTATVKPFAKKK